MAAPQTFSDLNRSVPLTAQFVDGATPTPNPIPAPVGSSATWTSGDPTLFTIDTTADPTGVTANLKLTGKLGTALLSLSAIAGTVGPTETDTAQVTISPGAAGGVQIVFGTPSNT